MESSILHFSPCIDNNVFTTTLRNWALPGLDGIQGFWWKHFGSVHSYFFWRFNEILQCEQNVPSWLPLGKTILMPKTNDSTNPRNDRPIACLNVAYKVWTGCLTSLMSDHCATNQLIHLAQKGCAKGQYGCTDHLLLTNRIWHQVHSENHSFSVTWIDYKKAFNSVPHNWIIICLRLFNFLLTLICCLQHLMPLWRTTLFLQLPHAPLYNCLLY